MTTTSLGSAQARSLANFASVLMELSNYEYELLLATAPVSTDNRTPGVSDNNEGSVVCNIVSRDTDGAMHINTRGPPCPNVVPSFASDDMVVTLSGSNKSPQQDIQNNS